MPAGPGHKKTKPTSRYKLSDICADLGRVRVGRGRARDAVKQRLGGVSDTQAEEFVRRLLPSVTPDAFVRTDELISYRATNGAPLFADVYGVQDKHGDWYVKVYIDGAVVVLSCHEPEGTLVRVDGKKIGRPRK